MTDAARDRYGAWEIDGVLARHLGLRIVPSGTETLVLAGSIEFHVSGPDREALSDSYQVQLEIPPAFPRVVPLVWETGGRIAASFHKLVGGSLCLGAPMELRLHLVRFPTLPTFIDRFVIPYLFGHSYHQKHGTMPFGERSHGSDGVLEYIAELFQSKQIEHAHEFLRLASLEKRHANGQPCPCESGQRLGRCHHLTVNRLRRQHGRGWFRQEYHRLVTQLGIPARE